MNTWDSFRVAFAWAVVILLVAIPVQIWAQVPSWQTVVALSQTAGSYSEVYESAADANGNVYITGVFGGTVDIGGTVLTSAGGDDAFLAKWSSATNSIAWARRIGGPGVDQPYGLAANGTGVVVAGAFAGTASFGTSTLTSIGIGDGFAARYTEAGSLAWTWQIGGAGSDIAYGVALSGANVYLTGGFQGTVALGGGVGLSSVGNSPDAFVVKLTDTGTSAVPAWALKGGGTGTDEGFTVLANGNNVYVAGYFATTAASFGSFTLASAGSSDAFVAKITDAGPTASFEWAQRAGGTGVDVATIMALNGSSVYVAGYFSSASAAFGSTVLGGSNTTGQAFITRLTDSGATAAFNWAQQAGGTGASDVWGIKTSGTSVYISGSFSGMASFGSTAFSTLGSDDTYVAKLTDAASSAVFDWAQRGGGAGSDHGFGLVLTGTSLYLTGGVTPPAAFGSLPIAAGAGSNRVGFLASLNYSTGLPAQVAVPLAGSYLFPNPTHGRAIVQVPAIPGAFVATITLLDALGRTLRTQTAATNAEALLPLAGLSAGLYAVRVQAGGHTATHRLVVE
jgi:hypothetical protein